MSILACEQALLFGQAEQASRERASEGLRRSRDMTSPFNDDDDNNDAFSSLSIHRNNLM